MGIRLSRGILIVIEGIDGSGKTTQADLLARGLERAGLDVLRAREPTDGVHGRRLRESATHGRLAPREELEAFLADRKEHVSLTLAPALEAGKVVILDRYYFSTAAYQGARGIDWRAILAQNEEFAPAPDLLVYIRLPVEVAVRRIENRDRRTNLFERRETLARVAEIFDTIDEPYLVRIDGESAIGAVRARIAEAADEVLRPVVGRSVLGADRSGRALGDRGES